VGPVAKREREIYRTVERNILMDRVGRGGGAPLLPERRALNLLWPYLSPFQRRMLATCPLLFEPVPHRRVCWIINLRPFPLVRVTPERYHVLCMSDTGYYADDPAPALGRHMPWLDAVLTFLLHIRAGHERLLISAADAVQNYDPDGLKHQIAEARAALRSGVRLLRSSLGALKRT
jgi:hypothetical protein